MLDIEKIAEMIIPLEESQIDPANGMTINNTDKFWHYTCKHYNTETKMCMNYEQRTEICKDHGERYSCHYTACILKCEKKSFLMKEDS